MKANDKALDEALSVTQIPEENMREYMRRVLTAAFAAQFPPSEDYAGLVKWLRDKAESLSEIYPPEAEAADALEALLAERDALKVELAAGHMWIQMRATVFEELAMVRAERDALLARLAPVEAIENDKDDPTREYIPLPGGWEIQTKGRGSSYRLLDKKTGERHMILAGDAPFVQEFVTRMAKEINASAQVRPVAPVDDEALVEIAAQIVASHCGFVWGSSGWDRSAMLEGTRAAIAAIRPHIEAAAYEDAARFIEENVFNYSSTENNYWSKRKGGDSNGLEYAREFREKAAAIRSGK